jgi:predicted nicotinamide N-methyase
MKTLPTLKYDTHIQKESFGPLELTLETVADLDKAIDSLCEGINDEDAEKIFVQDLCPYFGVVWPAARALSTHLARMGEWLKDKTILEVGCGLALPSLISAKLGAKVLATDFHPDVPKFLERNIKHNNLSLEYKSLNWREPNQKLGTFDFIIGSDVLYESSHPKDLAHALIKFCGKDSHILISDPGRAYLQLFTDEMKNLGFQHEVFIHTVLDSHSNRAGDQKTREVFVLSF